MSDPVRFTYNNSASSHDLTQYRKSKSRESCGVWRIDGWAWKIFSNLNQYDRIESVYATARTHGLPIPTSYLYTGHITHRNKRTSNGFALASTYMDRPAQFFTMQTRKANFKPLINSIADDEILSRIQAACTKALAFGLRDPQGFINQYDRNNPIVFIDLHTAAHASASVSEMYDIVTSRRASLQRQRR